MFKSNLWFLPKKNQTFDHSSKQKNQTFDPFTIMLYGSPVLGYTARYLIGKI